MIASEVTFCATYIVRLLRFSACSLCVFSEAITCNHRSPIIWPLGARRCNFFRHWIYLFFSSLCQFPEWLSVITARISVEAAAEWWRRRRRRSKRAQLVIKVVESCFLVVYGAKRNLSLFLAFQEGQSDSWALGYRSKVNKSGDQRVEYCIWSFSVLTCTVRSPDRCTIDTSNGVIADVSEQVGLAC